MRSLKVFAGMQGLRSNAMQQNLVIAGVSISF